MKQVRGQLPPCPPTSVGPLSIDSKQRKKEQVLYPHCHVGLSIRSIFSVPLTLYVVQARR